MSPAGRPWRAAAVVWAGVILVFGLLPTQGAVEAVSGGRDTLVTTAGHFGAYLLLGCLVGAALGDLAAGWQRLLLTLALAAALGGVIEVAQGPLPYRDAQLTDFLVNLAGSVVGFTLFSAGARSRRSPWRRG